MSASDITPDWLDLDGTVNARVVVPQVLIRADNLQALTPRDVRRLVEREALEVVLDLRTGYEVRSEGPGPLTGEPAVRIEHRSLYPESGRATDLEVGTVVPWFDDDAGESREEPRVVRAYMNYLSRRPDSIVGAVQAIARAEGAALVHCAAGKDRTGVVVALALDAAGIDRAAIVADYLATRERIDAIMARLFASETYRADLERYAGREHAPKPGMMERVLGLVDERFGGSSAWLTENGLSDADHERLTRRLTSVATSTPPA